MQSSMFMFVVLGGMFLVMWLFMIRPQRKKQKETEQMRSNLRAGDEVTTIGGFVGTIVKVKGDRVIIRVGAGKTKLEIMTWGISKVNAQADGRAYDEEEAEEGKPKRMKKKASNDEIEEDIDEEIDEIDDDEVEEAKEEVKKTAEEVEDEVEESTKE